MAGVRAAQKRRKTMTPEERAEEIEATRLSMGMLLIAIVREMKASDKRQEERDKQRADAKGSIADPLEVDDDDGEEDNDNENDRREDELFSNDSNPETNTGFRPIYANFPDGIDPEDDDPGGSWHNGSKPCVSFWVAVVGEEFVLPSVIVVVIFSR